MRLPWRLEITQPAGVAHGAALAPLMARGALAYKVSSRILEEEAG
jgi:hypothetical protein